MITSEGVLFGPVIGTDEALESVHFMTGLPWLVYFAGVALLFHVPDGLVTCRSTYLTTE